MSLTRFYNECVTFIKIYMYLIYTIKLQIKNKLQTKFYTKNIYEATFFYSFSSRNHEWGRRVARSTGVAAIWGLSKKRCHPAGHFNCCSETVKSITASRSDKRSAKGRQAS